MKAIILVDLENMSYHRLGFLELLKDKDVEIIFFTHKNNVVAGRIPLSLKQQFKKYGITYRIENIGDLSGRRQFGVSVQLAIYLALLISKTESTCSYYVFTVQEPHSRIKFIYKEAIEYLQQEFKCDVKTIDSLKQISLTEISPKQAHESLPTIRENFTISKFELENSNLLLSLKKSASSKDKVILFSYSNSKCLDMDWWFFEDVKWRNKSMVKHNGQKTYIRFSGQYEIRDSNGKLLKDGVLKDLI